MPPPGPAKQARIEQLLRKSLLGEEPVNTQFHLFSARSSASGRVLKPHALCANNVLLAKSSKYFLDLLSSDISPSDPSLIDLTHDNDVPSDARIEDYGYGSDSDLDDCNDPVSITVQKDRSECQDDDAVSDDGSESDGSDLFVMSSEQPKEDEPVSANKDGGGSVASSETAVQDAADNKTLRNQTAIRLRSLGSRHVHVKDTAFQTWYTLLNYLYTDNFSFLPLSSTTPSGQPRESSTSSIDEPKCSAKSMYRLASKIGLDDLREEAFSYIRSNLTETNILKEVSCSLVATHPELLDMELDELYSYIDSSPVVADFPALARRIANKELAHGADIVVGIYTRLVKESRPLPLRPPPSMGSRWALEPVKSDDVNDVRKVKGKDDTGETCVPIVQQNVVSGFGTFGSKPTPAPAMPVSASFKAPAGARQWMGPSKSEPQPTPKTAPLSSIWGTALNRVEDDDECQ